MIQTSVHLENAVHQQCRESGMTMRGLVDLGLKAATNRLEGNEMLMELKHENEQLRKAVSSMQRRIYELEIEAQHAVL